ncbi:MAG: cytochrome c family protein [Proteobacteria bacterium]|nr:cytochrome c family protein [Pseudomonadota bacterium]
MAQRLPFRSKKVIMPAIILLIIFCSIAGGYSAVKSENARPDIILIDLPAIKGGEQMPAVQFLHDKHTEKLEGKKDCSLCHLKENNKLVFKYKRIKDGTTKNDMAIYHDNCIACHLENKKANRPSGPLAGDCRSCHNLKSRNNSSWKQIDFNKSLHFRHESSVDIKPLKNKDEVNCSACHHNFDKKTKKTVYIKGEEESCFYCHKSVKTKNTSSMQTASHAACINCHQILKEQAKAAGPVECKACHDNAEQKKIKTVESISRMKRNQPDTILLANWAKAQKIDEKTIGKQLNPVPFDHKAHESKAENCKSCHHESLKPCADCHTETGSKDGGFVRLEQAMHNSKSEKSCIGCHKTAQLEKNCAGCHSAMPEKTLSNEKCIACHSIDKTMLGTFPVSKEKRAEIARRELNVKMSFVKKIPDEKIPEKVTIGLITDKYEAVTLPHRKMFRTLESKINDNKIAGYFHADKTTLCASCHHNSPVSLEPPKCASCHGKTSNSSQDGRPALKGAYHGQCITCHQVMGIKEPAATDCTKCHKEKKGN